MYMSTLFERTAGGLQVRGKQDIAQFPSRGKTWPIKYERIPHPGKQVVLHFPEVGPNE